MNEEVFGVHVGGDCHLLKPAGVFWGLGIDQRVRLCIGLDRWVKAVYRFKQMGQALVYMDRGCSNSNRPSSRQ